MEQDLVRSVEETEAAASLTLAVPVTAGGALPAGGDAGKGGTKRQMSMSPAQLPASKGGRLSPVQDAMYSDLLNRMVRLEAAVEAQGATMGISLGSLEAMVENKNEEFKLNLNEQGEHIISLSDQMDEMRAALAQMERDMKANIAKEVAEAMKPHTERAARLQEEAKVSASGRPETPAEMGLFLTGVGRLAALSGRHYADPVEAVRDLLMEAEQWWFHDRIVLPLGRNKTRKDAVSAIVYFRSIQQRKAAVVAIKRVLGRYKMIGVGLRDLFPAEAMAEVGYLHRAGLAMREAGLVTRFRVVNIRDKPVLQANKDGGSYRNIQEKEYIGLEFEGRRVDHNVLRNEANEDTSAEAAPAAARRPVVPQPGTQPGSYPAAKGAVTRPALGSRSLKSIPAGGQASHCAPPNGYSAILRLRDRAAQKDAASEAVTPMDAADTTAETSA